MRRSRKPFRAVSSDEGSNPSPSALQAESREFMRDSGLPSACSEEAEAWLGQALLTYPTMEFARQAGIV